jgi:hypothetical protein
MYENFRPQTNFEPLPTQQVCAQENGARSGEKRNTQPVVCQEQSLGTWQKWKNGSAACARSRMQIYRRTPPLSHIRRPEAHFFAHSARDKLDVLLFEEDLLRRIHCFRLMRA